MSLKLRIGIVGFGRMGRAIAVGLARASVDREFIAVNDKLPEAIDEARSRGFKTFTNLEDLALYSDIIVIAVKPRDVEDVAKNLREFVKGKKVVSIAALIKLNTLRELLPDADIYRAMPNIAVEVNKGFIALAPDDRKDTEVENLFKLLGEVEWVGEELLDILTFYSASTPAIVAELYDVFLLSALKAGLPYNIAKKAIAYVFQGVANLLQIKDVSTIRDSVITPKGVTIKAIEKLYTYGVKQVLLKALNDAFDEYNRLLEETKQ
jgi:pyrroline-5-carboxylate reductase